MDDIQFFGQVQAGDEYRIEEGMLPGAVFIGEQDVVRILDLRHFQGVNVKVVLHQGTDDWELEFTGPMHVSQGYGDMEGNPWMADTLQVGKEDLLYHLLTRPNEHVAMSVFVL